VNVGTTFQKKTISKQERNEIIIQLYESGLEVVHHINGDVTDNRIENLQVIKQSEHAKIHCKENPRVNFLNVYKKIKRDKKGRFIKYGKC